jgi:arylformamidase
LSSNTAVWPGDVSLQRDVQVKFEKGMNFELSSLTSTVHIGAHADAPSHYVADAPTIEAVDLSPYLGPCVVVATENKPLIEPSDCEVAIKSGAKRILFKTSSFPDPNQFNESFTSFSPEAMTQMGQAGVLLIGIDTPSIDPFSSKELPCHQLIYQFGMRNLEGLDLRQVEPGSYELIALPLKLAGFDASPVRAILRTI